MSKNFAILPDEEPCMINEQEREAIVNIETAIV
jgi:hypothetical protein